MIDIWIVIDYKLLNMIYTKLITGAFLLLSIIYYGMVIGQLFGWWKITCRIFTFTRLCIPFYYWFAPQKENKHCQTNKTEKL